MFIVLRENYNHVCLVKLLSEMYFLVVLAEQNKFFYNIGITNINIA